MNAGTLLSAGALLDGKYEVLGRLGQGGMGAVYRARHRLLHHEVAIKVPAAEELTTDTRERLLREARAAAILKSDHVCRVLDVGAEHEAPYIVLELLDGRDLGAVIRANGRLAPPLAAAVFADACEALAEAHALGIVHRDVKPSNVFLARRAGKAPIVKVLDFGISKVRSPALTGDVPALTSTMAMLGTPSYVSPEQIASSRNVDSRADVWAVGVCLYQAVCGRLPFTGESVMDLAVRISTEDLTAPRTYAPELSAELEAVILRCLAKDRDERFASAAELREALLPFASAEGLAALVEPASPVLVADEPSSGGITITSPGTPPEGMTGVTTMATPAAEPRRRRWSALAVPLVLAVALGAGLLALRAHATPSAGAAVPTAVPSPDPSSAASAAPTTEPGAMPTGASPTTEPGAMPTGTSPTAEPAAALPPTSASASTKRRPRPAPPRPTATSHDALPNVR